MYLHYATAHPLESTLASVSLTDPDADDDPTDSPDFAREETDEIFQNAITLDRVGLNKFAQDTNGQGSLYALRKDEASDAEMRELGRNVRRHFCGM